MLIIGIAGGSGSGKTTVVNEIMNSLNHDSVSVISQDAYYYDNSLLSTEEKKKINFDHPNAIEWSLLIDHLDMLKGGKSIEMPVYSYVSCSRDNKTITINPQKVLIVEGILILSQEQVRDRFDIIVYVDADADDRIVRIIKRDTLDRGRTLEDVINHYKTFVKPMHLQFIEPNKRYADIIIPRGGKNQVGIDILTHKIKANT